MRLLVVDHTAVFSIDRELYYWLEDQYHIDITLMVPRRWHEHSQNLIAVDDTLLNLVRSSTIFTGRAHRVLYVALSKYLKIIKPHILLVNAEPENFLAWQATLLRNHISPTTKLIFISWRNIDYKRGSFPYKFSFLNKVCEDYVLKHADHCIAYNNTARDIFKRKGFNNITAIPPSVNTKVFTKTNNTHSPTFVIGYIGRLIKEKGVDILIKAVKDLQFDYRLLIVGDGVEKQPLTELVHKLGIDNHVDFFSSSLHSDIPNHLNLIDVLVLPSFTGKFWKEQFGRILIEAMACEVPVIGSDSGEIPSVIGDAGLIFEEQSVEDLKNKIQLIYENKILRKDLINKGLERVKTKYSVEVISKQYYKLFSDLLKEQKV